jgi:hypothetical protein
MSVDSNVPDLYRGKINLWVEDSLTKEYLKGVWEDDPDFTFMIAGGNENVSAILRDAEEQDRINVFGYIDRDFGRSNRPDWNNPDKQSHRFVSDQHEIENFLLDPAALEGCALNTGGRRADDIELRMRKRAEELAWWMACRQVIVILRNDFRENFLEHPKCPKIVDSTSAVEYITSQPWFTCLRERATAVAAPGEIQLRVEAKHQEMEAALADGSWRSEFSGKELFRDVRGWIYQAPPGEGSSRSDLDIDLAKAIAWWQVENNAVPEELKELRRAMQQRMAQAVAATSPTG